MRELAYVAAPIGVALILLTLLDAFEIVLLPRPARHPLRLNRLLFFCTWAVWARAALRVSAGRRREDFIGIYGPLSMVLLFGLWAVCLITGFGLLQWALQAMTSNASLQSLGRELFMSGNAFFTLGYGDIVPRGGTSRIAVILEAGTGFGFIALTIGYLPVLYQHFTRRDVQLIEISARAGSPPTALAVLQWYAVEGDTLFMEQWLRDWERWSCDMVESHSVYPVLAYYRSQHTGHSWLASLNVVLDVCTLLIAGTEGRGLRQAEATFSASRRVLDEISSSLNIALPPWAAEDRLDVQTFAALSRELEGAQIGWQAASDTGRLMAQLRSTYEPQLRGLSVYLLLPLPAWVGTAKGRGFTRQDVAERLNRQARKRR